MQFSELQLTHLFNPLTTDDECTHHATFTECYQLIVIHFDDMICASKKGEIGEDGQAYS